MNDTPQIVEERYHRLLMQKTGEERLRMGCSMFDAAREIVKSSILSEFPDISPRQMRQKIFLRFYGKDFSQEQKEEILKELR